MVPIEEKIEHLRQRARISARVRQQLDQMVSEIEQLRSAGELGDDTDGILSHWLDELVAGQLTEEQARAIPGQLVAARDLMLSAFAEMERGPEVDKDNLFDLLAFVFKSSDIAGVARLVIRVYQLGLRIDIDQIQAFLTPFLHCNLIDEIMRRVNRLGQWMTQFDGRNYEGVMFTPVVTRYLAEHSDFEAALAEFDRLRTETLKGHFRLDNALQRDLEFLRFAHLNANLNGGQRGGDEQYAAFKLRCRCYRRLVPGDSRTKWGASRPSEALRIPRCVFPTVPQTLQGQGRQDRSWWLGTTAMADSGLLSHFRTI